MIIFELIKEQNKRK